VFLLVPRALVRVLLCYGALEIVSVIIIIILPVHPGSPGQRAIKRLLFCCVSDNENNYKSKQDKNTFL